MATQKPVVLVTGSSGYVGAAAVAELSATHRVIGLDERPPATMAHLEEFVPLDIVADESVRSAVEHIRKRYGSRIASVIHLIAYYDFEGQPSPLYDEVTVGGTARLLDALERLDVEQFVYASTMLVHAPTEPGRPITESSPIEPRWDYPRSKVAAESVVRERHGSMHGVILRMAGVYDDACHSIPIARHIQRIHERKLVSRLFPGDPSHGQAYVHLDDLADALKRSVERRANLAEHEVFLIAEPRTTSYEGFQQLIATTLHGERWSTETIPKPLAKAGAWLQDQIPGEDPFIKPWMVDIADDHYEFDISRARTKLGWNPRHDVGMALPAMCRELLRDPVRFYRENRLELPASLAREARAPRASHPPAEAR